MRLIKMFGLTALAAVAAMAFIGASSASATSTQLCKVHVEPCSAGNAVTGIHMVNKGNLVLEATFIVTVTIECKASLGQATLGALANPQIATVTKLTWEECTQGGNNCTVTTTNLGTFNILKTALNLGFAEANKTKVHVVCPGIIDCEYEANGKKLALEGSGHTAGAGNGMLTAKKLPVDKVAGGFTCPNSSLWTALYEPLEKVFGVS